MVARKLKAGLSTEDAWSLREKGWDSCAVVPAAMYTIFAYERTNFQKGGAAEINGETVVIV